MIEYEFPSCSNEEIFHLDYCHYERDCVVVALQRKLFDFIKEEGPLSKSDLIKKCDFGTRGGNAVINLLCGMKYLRIINQKYCLTSISSNYLVSTSPFYYGNMLTLHYVARPEVEKAFELDKKNQHDSHFIHVWEANKLTKEEAERIAAAMHSISFVTAVGFAKCINLNQTFGTKGMLDVGGGSGCFSIATSIHQPNIKTIVLDLQEACTACEKYINNAKNLPSNSVLTYACNMFTEPFPKYDDPKYSYNTVFMSNILHDWDEGSRIFLCKKIYNALPIGGTILIHEALFNDDESGPLYSALYSFHMFIVTKGKQFTFVEMKDLLMSCGFEDVNVLPPTHQIYSVISGKN